MTELAFVQLNVSDLDTAYRLYVDRLALRSVRRERLAGEAVERLWRLPPRNDSRLCDARAARPGGAGGTPTGPDEPRRRDPLRAGLPTYYPGPFGFSMGALDPVATIDVLREFGGEPLSDPHDFPGRPGRPDTQAQETVVGMPDSYYIMLFKLFPGTIRFRPPGSGGLTEIFSVSVFSRDAAATHRFWHDGLGLDFTPITEGPNDDWLRTRGIASGNTIRTGSFHAPGAERRPVFRCVVPGLSDTAKFDRPGRDAPGICVVGIRTPGSSRGDCPAAGPGLPGPRRGQDLGSPRTTVRGRSSRRSWRRMRTNRRDFLTVGAVNFPFPSVFTKLSATWLASWKSEEGSHE